MTTTNISLPLYDKCRIWIEQARKLHHDWDAILLALQPNEESLKLFLGMQTASNFWPPVDPSMWFEIVNSEREAEAKSLAVTVKDKKAVLIDSTQDTDVTVPAGDRTSWQLYKAHLLDSGFKMESVEEIEQATLGLLKRLNSNTVETGPIKGLVIGHVQSGKTANMAALMAMAADWGWNLFIVLSGTIENLRSQTQSRLFRDLNRPGNLNWMGLEHLSKRSPLGHKAQNLRLEDNSNMRYFNVCLKNSGRLKNLIEWMQHDPHKHKQMKVIVIDDEADQASINTADIQSSERNKINKLIVNLVEGRTPKGDISNTQVRSMNYISYTATPYANFLNESTPESLYPRNFIRTLQPSNEYFGPRQIFGIEETDDCDGLNMVREICNEDYDMLQCLHKGEEKPLPESMVVSICWFLCAAGAMRVSGYVKPISMLIHTSQKQQHHQEVSDAVRDWLQTIDRSELLYKCETVWSIEREKLSKVDFRNTYSEYGRSDSEIMDYPDFMQISPQVEMLVENITHIPLGEDGDLQYHEGIHLCVDNCANNGVTEEGMFVRLAYPDPEKAPLKTAPVFIIVGGSTLSRGLTIEGLVSTYFLRSTCQADSLMQMGRWFGYRRGYELLPRIWMTPNTIKKFRFLAALEMELRQDLVRFMTAGADPLEFGPRVKNTPKATWLRITAKNRMQSAEEIGLDFTGTSSQTILFDNHEETLKQNIELTERFIKGLGQGEVSDLKSAFIWRDVAFGTIETDFLKPFRFQSRSRVFNEMKSFTDWVKHVSAEENLENWNVIVAGLGKVNDEHNQKPWKLPAGSVGKINRSRKKGSEENIINIGVLRAPKDLLSDVPHNRLTQESRDKIAGSVAASDIEKIRTEAGLERTPQLILYRIAKDSTARQDAKDREDLHAVEDLIGLCIVIPGNKPKNGKSSVLTIKINRKSYEEEVWGDEE